MEEITLDTPFGKITGLQKPCHLEFLGVRYARPPVGSLRFQPPQCLDAWESECDATNFAPVAPQAYPDTPPLQLPESEDCLTLNIYTPAADGRARPVMAFIHGGAFVIDSGSRPRTYGGHLAENEDVVVVTLEYRLGALGFLYLDGISPNLGLQDQICALKWIKTHIAAFGGDPGNVTIFGESAGAFSIAYLLIMPTARGLFHKAILESGALPVETPDQNRSTARQGTQKFLKQLKLSPTNLSALWETGLAAIQRATKKVAGNMLTSGRAFFPVIDGELVPNDAFGALQGGCSQGIPMLIGTNANELPVFGSIVKSKIQQWLVKNMFLRSLAKDGLDRSRVRQMLDLYRRSLPPSERVDGKEFNHLLTDQFFRIPAVRLAEAYQATTPDTYFYQFAHPAPSVKAAMHVMELYFVFGTLDTPDIADIMKVPCSEGEKHLSRQMMAAWASFARTGSPNTPGLPEWPRYEPVRRATMVLDVESHVEDAPEEEIRAAWMKI